MVTALNKKNMTYKKKLLFNFFAIFAVFTFVIIILQYNRESKYKKELLRSNLAAYTTILNNYIESENGDVNISYAPMVKILPHDLRITIIDKKGAVIFDNNNQGIAVTENHLARPEISSANINKYGTVIRESATTGEKYYYLATSFNNYFIRLALPYDMNMQILLKADNLYIYFILALFIGVFLSLILLSDRMGRSISALRDFAFSLSNGKIDDRVIFPEGELGDIGEKLVENYRSLERSKEELKREKDKLILHFSNSTVGIAFFSSTRKSIYSNTLFVTYMNTIADTPTIKIEDFFSIPEFTKYTEFIAKNSHGVLEDKINKNGQYYIIRVIIFEDRSVEVVLNNVTEVEKTRILKQEMTSNIAHELRTPVSSISGYMETLIDQKELSPEKREYFLERAYIQVQRLSELIRDISIITRIEEGQAEVEKEKINLSTMVKEALIELKPKIEKSCDKVENNIPDNIYVSGNSTLLYSIFRNLVDNAINYAGEKIEIRLDKFFEDEDFYYFSVSDNGKGIDDEHLTKIFDRFYRVSEGRTRQDGGSGLGLSIVKNAILFHGGKVSAKNRKEGGLEIIFSIKK